MDLLYDVLEQVCDAPLKLSNSLYFSAAWVAHIFTEPLRLPLRLTAQELPQPHAVLVRT